MYCTCVPQDGGYTLRGGPLDALIAYAASTTSAGVYIQYTYMMLQSMCIIWVSSLSFPTDMCVLLCSTVKQFTEAFLLTYYTFITPEKLISKLLSRYVQRMYVCVHVCMCAASLPHYTLLYCQIVEYLTLLLCAHTCGSISLASVPPENRWAVTICCVECDYRFVVVVCLLLLFGDCVQCVHPSYCRLYHFYKQGNKPVWTATISLLVRLLNNLKLVHIYSLLPTPSALVTPHISLKCGIYLTSN